MHAFSTVPSFRFQAVVYRVEIERYVFLDSVQKRREADKNFKFTEYIVMEIIHLFRYFNQFFPKINIYKIYKNCHFGSLKIILKWKFEINKYLQFEFIYKLKIFEIFKGKLKLENSNSRTFYQFCTLKKFSISELFSIKKR